ncbi:MAG: hypothetical protein HY340_03715 [Candidatus Kerfeldbacteria bacterium]|nr:hypothetical protein [Candidatus Kerfeldbacteria bacterium]
MERPSMQQVWQRIEAEKNILIALPARPSTDAIASGLALAQALAALDRKTDIVAHDFSLPPNHGFLVGHESIKPTLEQSNRLVISVDISRAPIDELSYDVRGDTLQVFLSPKSGRLAPSDVSATSGLPGHTLIVTLDVPDLAALGPLFEKNTDFFYATPIVNVDHHSGNTGYGQMNIVDLTATATAEVLYDLLTARESMVIDEMIATHLLAGIVAKTKAFLSPVVTPKTLSIASDLVTKGAKREEVLRQLYQSRPLAALRLWGRVFARLQSDVNGRFLWSRLRRDDFNKAGADAAALPGAIEELLHAAHRADIVLILSESTDGAVAVIAAARPAVDLTRLFQEYQPEPANGILRFTLPGVDLEAAERAVRSVVTHYYGSR